MARRLDLERRKSPGGAPLAPTLIAGAGGGVGAAALVASADGLHAGRPDDPGVAILALWARIQRARAARSARDQTSARRHAEAALALLHRFDPLACDSPALAGLRCALHADLPGGATPDRIAEDFEDLIDLDPRAPGALRDLGTGLAGTGPGRFDRVEAAARRTASRLHDVWGSGGYAWVWFDVLANEAEASEALDPPYFCEALHDIVARRPDQHTANTLAALVGFSLRPGPSAPTAWRRIAESLDWLLRDHMREIHPHVWAAAPAPGGAPGVTCTEAAAAVRGRARALSSLAQHFAPVIAAGGRVRVTPRGWQIRSG